MKSSKHTEKRKKKPGRQSLLTPETLAKFMAALKAGNYRDAACAYAGVARPTFYGWLAKGDEDPDSEYGEFRQHVMEAESQAEATMVMIWRTQMSTDYRAIRDFLERRYPSRWARREIVTHEGEVGQPSTATDLSKLSPEEWETFKGLRKKMQEPLT